MRITLFLKQSIINNNATKFNNSNVHTAVVGNLIGAF